MTEPAYERHVADLTLLGLSDEEARVVARMRVERQAATERPQGFRDLGVALALAVGAGAVILVASRLLGLESYAAVRNLALFVAPFLSAYLGWRHRLGARPLAWVVALFAAAAIAANVYPLTENSSTGLLLALAVPFWAWSAVGLAHMGDWRDRSRRMEFVRFTGEWVIYYGLIAIGGGALSLLTGAAFRAIGVEAFDVLANWMIPAGAAGAVVIAGYLVESRRGVVENMAPVLTKVFTPLATLMLLALVVAMVWTRAGTQTNRDLLIISDLLLILVLGLLIYAWSAREPSQSPGLFDGLQLALVGAALAVDLLGLIAMITRISTFGSTPNKWAALLLNLLLFVNLAWAARLLVGFLSGRRPFDDLTRWQLAYLPVFTAFAVFVVIAFPPIFAFR